MANGRRYVPGITVTFDDGVAVNLSVRDGLRLMNTLSREGWRPETKEEAGKREKETANGNQRS